MTTHYDKYYEPFQIIKFEKISDDIINIGKHLEIRICANLAKTFNGTKYFFYKEYEYFLNGSKHVSVKRGFDYYISIEELVKPKDRDKLFIRIGPAEFYGLMRLIQTAMKWFTDEEYSKLYARNGAELVFTSSHIPSSTLSDLPMGITINLSPDIMDTGKEFKPSLHMMVESKGNILDYYFSVDNLFAIYGSLVNYNMFMSAQTMVSSLGIPLGTNRVDLQDETNSNPLPTTTTQQDTGVNGRLIGKPKLEDLE